MLIVKNEKELYESRLEDKDKIINKLFEMNKMLIIGMFTMLTISVISLVIGWYIYLEAPVVEATNFNGDSNTNISNNSMDSSDIDLSQWYYKNNYIIEGRWYNMSGCKNKSKGSKSKGGGRKR